jgi:hypothetical protein
LLWWLRVGVRLVEVALDQVSDYVASKIEA